MLNQSENVVLAEQIKNNLTRCQKIKLIEKKIEISKKVNNRAANMLPQLETELDYLKFKNRTQKELLMKRFDCGGGK